VLVFVAVEVEDVSVLDVHVVPDVQVVVLVVVELTTAGAVTADPMASASLIFLATQLSLPMRKVMASHR